MAEWTIVGLWIVIGLALVMLLAIGFHVRRGERRAVVANAFLLALSVIAAFGTMALI